MRRHDLVPQLVTAVQAYAGHERAVLEAVTELRAQAVALQEPGASWAKSNRRWNRRSAACSR